LIPLWHPLSHRGFLFFKRRKMEKIIEKAERRICKSCGEFTLHNAQIGGCGPHYGKLICRICGSCWGFIKKPENLGKREKNKHTPSSLDIDFCQLCLRTRQDLINHETLESHHIIEVASPYNGPDIPENIWVLCTPCHRLLHHQRKYIRRASGDYTR